MHPLNVTSLVLGLLLLGGSGLWLADEAGWVGDQTYLLPLLLVGAGVVGLVAFALKGVAGHRGEEPPTDTDHPFDTDPFDAQETLR